jgi:hypothetical protein
MFRWDSTIDITIIRTEITSISRFGLEETFLDFTNFNKSVVIEVTFFNHKNVMFFWDFFTKRDMDISISIIITINIIG